MTLILISARPKIANYTRGGATNMDIQLLNMNQTDEGASLYSSAPCEFAMSDANAFWLHAPIFGTKRRSRWKRPD